MAIVKNRQPSTFMVLLIIFALLLISGTLLAAVRTSAPLNVATGLTMGILIGVLAMRWFQRRQTFQQLHAIAHQLDRFTQGDLTVVADTPSSPDEIGAIWSALARLSAAMRGMCAEAGGLIAACQDGHWEKRCNIAAFQGEWHTYLLSLNTALENLRAPLQVTAAYLERLSQGDIPDKITADYPGDFRDIAHNLNLLIDSMHEMTAVVEDMATGDLLHDARERSAHDRISQAVNRTIRELNALLLELDGLTMLVRAGHLDARGNVADFSGVWRDLLAEINNVIDAFVEVTRANEHLQLENLRMSAELNVVKQLQQMILPRPQELADIPGLDIAGYMQPADEVGGDYYDVLPEQGRLYLGIGDVTGHGLESGVLMLMTQAVIRALIEHGETNLAAFVNTLNRTIYKNVRRMGGEKTLTFALLKYQSGQLQIAGQHEDVLIVRQGGQVERVDTANLGFFIGLEENIAAFVAEATISLQPGESVVLYTDGITEAENAEHTLYGIQRLCDVIGRNWDQAAEAIKQAVIDDVIRYIGTHKVHDDLTLVVLKQQ